MATVRPIDANALIVQECGQCDGACDMFDGCKCLECYNHNRCELRMAVDSAPTLDYEPVRHGEWVQRSYFDECENVYTCSACEFDFTLIDGTPKDNCMIYCPSCGAKMDGGNTNA